METKRDSFASRWGFILACIGSAVGMGNIWLFPARVSGYGGGAFIIAYLIFVVLIGSTGVIGEMSFGRMARSGPIDAFGKATETKGSKKVGQALGAIPTLGSLALAIGYSVVMGWILKYAFSALTGTLLKPETVDEFTGVFGTMAGAFGNNIWQSIAVILTLVILVFGIGSGIEKANKIMMPLFFFLFVGLGIYIAFQPGAVDGYKYIFTVDTKALLDPHTWIYALGQAFFSLSVAGNGTLIYGSYLSEKEDIPKSAKNVAFFDTLAAMLAALVIIPAMATAGSTLNQGGPMLMFVFLPNLFKSMPGGSVIAIVFFIAVTFAGLTSLINLYESPIATLQERFKMKRLPACAIVCGAGLAISLCIQHIVSDWMDIISIYICPLGAGLAGIMFFWVLGKKVCEKEIAKGREKSVPTLIIPLAKYVFCPVCVLVLIAGALLGGIG